MTTTLARLTSALIPHVDSAGAAETGSKQPADKAQAENLASLLKMEELTLEIGFQLIPMVDEKQSGQLLSRVRTLRRRLAVDLGFILPPIHITDNLRLKPREYVLSLRGSEIDRWHLEGGGQVLAVSADPKIRPIPGKETREPAFGVNARWIAPVLEEQALAAGYSVVDSTTVVSMHISELLRRHAHDLLSRAETKRLVETLNESHPKLIEELIPKILTLGEVQRVFQQLLREGVSIRDLGTVLETLVEIAPQSKTLPYLVDSVRQVIGRRMIQRLLDGEGTLPVLLFDPATEEELLGHFSGDANRLLTDRSRNSTTPLMKSIEDFSKSLSGNGGATALPVLLCPSPARYQLRRWLEAFMPRVTVLAPSEIPPDVPVRSLGVVRCRSLAEIKLDQDRSHSHAKELSEYCPANS